MILLLSFPFLPISSLSLSEPCSIYCIAKMRSTTIMIFFLFQFIFCIVALRLSDYVAYPVLEDCLRTVASSDKGILYRENFRENSEDKSCHRKMIIKEIPE